MRRPPLWKHEVDGYRFVIQEYPKGYFNLWRDGDEYDAELFESWSEVYAEIDAYVERLRPRSPKQEAQADD